MKSISDIKINKNSALLIFCTAIFLFLSNKIEAQEEVVEDFIEYRGTVIDSKSKKTLEFATISVNESNISTVTNRDGNFLLKVPKNKANQSITITYLGYGNKMIPLSDFNGTVLKIRLIEDVLELPEVNVISKDPDMIIRKLMLNRNKNHFEDPLLMKAFYRESIKKRRTYASLSEAVVDIYKKPYASNSLDYVILQRARKSTDYKKLDTLVIKLQGGPYNTLNIDMVKNKDFFFNEDIFKNYKFTFDKYISVDNRGTYVVNFIQSENIYEPMFYGKLYIDAQTFALSKAIFSLKLSNKTQASKYFVKKKPSKANVIPMVANYRIDYRMKEDKWFFSYGRVELSFKIDWKKRIFNSVYNLDIEMAITDWKKITKEELIKSKERLRKNVILNDKASGFSSPEFWGKDNVIEPDKSIENAIKKIQRHLQ